MASGIRKGVEQRITRSIARNDIVGFVIIGLRDTSEQAFHQRRFGRQDILQAPGSMQRFHWAKLVREPWHVKTTTPSRTLFPRPQAAAHDVNKGLDCEFDKKEWLGYEIVSAAYHGVGPAFQVG